MGRIFAGIIGFFVFIAASSVVFGSWYTIDEGERGVLTRNGAVVGTATPGLGFKMPMIDGVEKITVRTEIINFDRLGAYSRDQQSAEMRVSVNYRILPDAVKDVYSNYGSADGIAARLIQPRIFETLKTVFGQFTAVSAIQEREKLNTMVRDAIAKSVGGPIVIEGVQIENIDFSDAYEASIEQRMLAEVEVQKLRQNAEREKVQGEITVTQANAKADAVRAAASAEAEAIRIRGEAEASAIKSRGAALRDNPGLVDLTQAERWNGQLPQTMVPNGAVPFLGTK
ncbi:prohibitin family protein [Endobacterium cereale]|uniref:prohibitin family protein n=1 Tax=Endobacterium cereale TaxID=2663029 RepID=UPI002B46E491|nr:prohibitin family protein [Endobacterium cereale]MEB2845893.1 prohibitin family protein [Endobacterium cereale]